MRTTTQLNTGLTAAAFLLIGALAVAQTAPNARGVRPREAQSGQSSGWQGQYNPSASSGRLHPHSNSSNNKTLGSAHATEGKATSDVVQERTSPLHEDSGKSGSNPMYEGKSQANIKPGAGASAAPYKDPEDMTTRYRPGNNKTTGSAATQGAGTAQQSNQGTLGPDVYTRKHIGNVKYSNRTSTGNDSSSGQSTPASPASR